MSAGKVDVLAVMDRAQAILGGSASVSAQVETAAELDEAAEIVAAVIEAASEVQCGCSVHERNSGHRIGCAMPNLSAALARIGGAP